MADEAAHSQINVDLVSELVLVATHLWRRRANAGLV